MRHAKIINQFVRHREQNKVFQNKGQSLDAREAVSPTEALRAYTTLGAFSGREEKDKGSLALGKLADLAVLDRDFFSIDPDDIRNVVVDMTIVGGAVRYRRE